jgi:methylated-DNA-[protein]-cysteine S-methyltransferase
LLGSRSALGYAAAVRIAYHMMASPVGLLFLGRSEKGLRHLEFMDRRSIKRMIASHEAGNPGAKWEPSLLDLKETVDQLDAFFNGMLREFELPLDLVGSEFQVKVWKALGTIPYGETRTYGQIAKTIKQPKATRAIGLANNQNPVAIVVPCHRVIGADGSLTGYGGGLPKKRWLLDHETQHNVRAATAQELFAGTAQREGRSPRGR